MKNLKFYLASICVATLVISCEKVVEINQPENNEATAPQLTTITCEFPSMVDQNGTKVTLGTDGTMGWEAGNKIVIYGKRNRVASDKDSEDHPELDRVIHELTAAEVADPSKAVFTVDLSGLTTDPAGNHPYNAVYPYQDDDDFLPFYSKWGASGRARFKNTNDLLLAGWVDGGTMTLKNVCCAITFTVSGSYDSYYFSGYNGTEIVGYGQYLVEFNNSENKPIVDQYHRKDGEEWGCNTPLTEISGPVVGDGTTLNYIYIPNEVALPDGFTITLAWKGKKVKTITSDAELNLTHDHMINLGSLPSAKMKDVTAFSAVEMSGATDKSADVSANCYIVDGSDDANAGKVFKFRTVKGNSFVNGSSVGESVGSAYVAEVLWETWNSSSVTAKSVIEKVDYYDGYVYFKVPDPIHEGNALIAVKDEDGHILWSWHIWIPSTTITSNSYGLYDHEIMDRYLGALDKATTSSVPVETYGLTYQWGRKDPFVGAAATTGSTNATVAGTAVTLAGGALTLEQSIQNPTVLGKGKDWLDTPDNNLWKNSNVKTIYDPCPAGYKVPAYDSGQPLFKDLSTVTGWDDSHGSDHYFKLGSPESVFPYAGYREENSTSMYSSAVGSRAAIWTSYANSDTEAYHINVRNGTSTHSTGSTAKARSCVVRCAKLDYVPLSLVYGGATSVVLNGSMDDWSSATAAYTTSSGPIRQWKFGSDASYIYFYVKVRLTSIAAKDDGTYEKKKYIYIGIDTDNNPTTGVTPNYGGLTIPGCEALAFIYPFRGSVPDGQSAPAGVEFVNGVEGNSWTRVPANGSTTGKQCTVWGCKDESYAYLEIGIPRDGIGEPAGKEFAVQFSFSYELTPRTGISFE
jgi:hypothetical protein